jgi:hypothetical protein
LWPESGLSHEWAKLGHATSITYDARSPWYEMCLPPSVMGIPNGSVLTFVSPSTRLQQDPLTTAARSLRGLLHGMPFKRGAGRERSDLLAATLTVIKVCAARLDSTDEQRLFKVARQRLLRCAAVLLSLRDCGLINEESFGQAQALIDDLDRQWATVVTTSETSSAATVKEKPGPGSWPRPSLVIVDEPSSQPGDDAGGPPTAPSSWEIVAVSVGDELPDFGKG